MSKVISTYGVASKFTTDALMGMGATQQDANGRFFLDGSAVNVELSRVIAESIYIQDIFRDGQSVTGKYTTAPMQGGAVRVALNTPLPFTSRTLSYGGRRGTTGNAGFINQNAAQLPATDEFIIYTNQVNDQMMLFPELAKEYLPLDIAAKKIADYSQRVSMDKSASTLAEVLAYAFFRSLNDGNNLITEGDLTAENAYAELINKVNSNLDNGDQVRGAFTFPTEGRTIIGRPSFINSIFSRKSGVIMLGGDLAQTMLKEYDLDARMSERSYVGTGYRGNAMGIHFQIAPDYIWTLAEAYCGVAKGSFKDIDAIAVSFDATAVATGIDLGVKMVDSNVVRGSLAQPLNIWGHEAFRKSYVIGKSTLTNDFLAGLGFDAETRVHPIAPKDIENEQKDTITVPVYDKNGAVVAFREIASVPRPNGDNIQSGIPQVKNVSSNVKPGVIEGGTQVTLSTATGGATMYYTDDGTEPTSASTRYTVPIRIDATKTLKAFAVKDGMYPSVVTTFKYTVNA